MWFLLFLPILYATAVLETSLADTLQVGHVAPDLLALLAVVWSLLRSGRWTFVIAGLVGLASDLIAPGRVGPGAACFLLIGYAVMRLRQNFKLNHPVRQVPLVFVAVTALAACLATGRWLLGEAGVPLSAILARTVFVGVYTAGVSVPVLMAVHWLRNPLLVRKDTLAEI